MSNLKSNINKAKEIVISFDTTGSMAPAIANVRKNLHTVCSELFEENKNLKVGIIAHGDYIDGDNCINVLDLTNDKQQVLNFIMQTPNTNGGDYPECYEYVLYRAKLLSWNKRHKNKILVLIGDAYPHPVTYPQNTLQLNWHQELCDLKQRNINVYPLQCLYNINMCEANSFWQEIANIHNTPLLKLDNFEDSQHVLPAFAATLSGADSVTQYTKRLHQRYGACGQSVPSSVAVTCNTLLKESEKYVK